MPDITVAVRTLPTNLGKGEHGASQGEKSLDLQSTHIYFLFNYVVLFVRFAAPSGQS